MCANAGASGSAVEAIPDADYHFVDWSDSSADNPRTDANVSGDISVTANFAYNCGQTFVDSRDGQSYPTVQIGAQCWFQKNLNIGTMINASVPQGDFSAGLQKYCYNNHENNPNYIFENIIEVSHLPDY